MSSSSLSNLTKQRFRGALIGALVGDCYGAPFEHRRSTNANTLIEDIDALSRKESVLRYTDDTAMTISTCKSLIENKGLNARKLAKEFAESYFRQPNRGYGAAVKTVFTSLRDSNYQDPFGPAASQFDGKGSYGNGAAMRCVGIALFAYREKLDDKKSIDLSEECAKITHSNAHGINGATLLVMAVKYLLQVGEDELNEIKLLEYLIQMIGSREDRREMVYTDKLKIIKKVLEDINISGTDLNQNETVRLLGNDVAAQNSVPLALYSFLRGNSKFNDSYSIENEFSRTLHWAISCGGDTDTIASMACALSGAYLGLDSIPDNLYKNCEAWQYVADLADRLFTDESNI